MKNKFILSVLFSVFINVKVYAQGWQWAKHFGGIHDDWVYPICLDSSGNIYVTGEFSFPQGYFGNDSLQVDGLRDIFIVKFDSNGNFIWSKKAGSIDNGNTNESAEDIKFESSTNSIIIGGIMSGINGMIDSCKASSGFLSKLDLQGKCIWERDALAGDISSFLITLDNNGHIYIAGQARYGVNIEGFPIQYGCFLAKFKSNDGTCLWAKNIMKFSNLTGGYTGDIKYFNNAIYVGGMVESDTLLLDTAIVHCYKNDVFIAKFDTDGVVTWAKTIGGPNKDNGGIIDVDSSGNIYTCGIFTDTAYFESTTLANGTLKDWYLAKYNNAGSLLWVRQAHATSYIWLGGLACNSSGVNVSGSFSGSATLGLSNITAATSSDMFLANYDTNGNCLGVAKGENILYCDRVIRKNNECYLIGGFKGTTNLGNNSLSSYGGNDVFVARIDSIFGSVGIEERKSERNKLYIYANPTTGKCGIQIPDDFLHEHNLLLNIYNNKGDLIQSKSVEMTHEGKIKLNLEAEAKGMYNVTLSNGRKMYYGKIIFE